jgi:pyruvate formate lyase activating enzyme
MTDPDDTPASTLLRAAEIGKNEGLNFVYAGNLPSRVGSWENTYCPGCNELLIERAGYRIRAMRIMNGCCPKCSRPIPGFWN